VVQIGCRARREECLDGTTRHPVAYQPSKRTTTETAAVNRAKGCSRALRLQNRRVQTVHSPVPGAYWPHGRQHQPASSPPTTPDAVALCELVLLKLCVLLRNPAVLKNPLDAAHTVVIVGTFRQHPTWRLIDYPGDTASVMDEVWRRAGQPNVGRWVVFNARLALTLCHHGGDGVRHAQPRPLCRFWLHSRLESVGDLTNLRHR
jgi:hypothetical protein